MEHSRDALNRRSLIKSAVAVTVALPAVMAASEGAAATGEANLTGVGEVIDKTDRGLVVRLQDGGGVLYLAPKDFGGVPISKGDLVAVMPDPPAGDFSGTDSVSAYPYLQIRPDGSVWSTDSSGNERRVGTRS